MTIVTGWSVAAALCLWADSESCGRAMQCETLVAAAGTGAAFAAPL